MIVDVNRLFEEIRRLPQVEAIALGGSRATGRNDERSDYDVYVYITGSIPERDRRRILEKYCDYMEIGNAFWELEDDVTLKDGIDMDIIYRNSKDFEKIVSSVVIDCVAWNGYTTCMWHNLRTCKILYDPLEKLGTAKQRFDVLYPEKLRSDIIRRNWKLLHAAMPAYELQIKKAILRGDSVSVNHRVSAFLESYFDVLFALNRQTHPGEKRLVSLCRKMCPILPENFEDNLNSLFSHMFTAPELVSDDLDRILSARAKILEI